MRVLCAPTALLLSVCAALPACGGGGAHPNVDRSSRPILRANLGVNLASVSTFAFLSGGGAAPFVGGGSMQKASDGGLGDGGQLGNASGLYAVTLAGDALAVTLVEEGNPNATGSPMQPTVTEIYATPSWVIFDTPSFVVNRPAGDGGVDSIGCDMIAARRADGALFCGPIAGRTSSFSLDPSLQTNAAGDVVYLSALTATTGTERLYRLALGDVAGPTATGITPPTAMALWFVANAAGDALYLYAPSPLAPATTLLGIVPADGSAPVSLGSGTGGFAVAGRAGDPDADTFYLMVGSGGGGFTGTIRVFTKQGASFVANDVMPNLANVSSYGMLMRLSDGIYLFDRTGMRLARIFAAGSMVAMPVPVALVGVDSLVDVQGLGAHPTGNEVIFLANTPTGQQFIRHDGVTQQNIPLPANLALTRVLFARSGAIDFIGARTDTLETVRGSIEAGATTAVVTTTGVLDPNRITVLTRLD